MPKQIILNSSNFNSSNNKLSYRFPVRQRFKKGDQIGLSTISIYNSFYNISSIYNNNIINFTFPSAVPIVKSFTIPNGYYSISDLNYFLQQQLISNGLYCISITNPNTYIYFLEFTTNAVRYSGQINFYALPTQAQATSMGYTIPAGVGWSFPTVPNTPSINFNSGFGSLLGFTAGIYPPTLSSVNIQFVSNTVPMLSVVNSIIMTCNLINNHGLSIPSTIFDSISILSGFGSVIHQNNTIVYSDIATNDYETVEIQFYDQNLNLLSILDPDVLITLSIIN